MHPEADEIGAAVRPPNNPGAPVRETIDTVSAAGESFEGLSSDPKSFRAALEPEAVGGAPFVAAIPPGEFVFTNLFAPEARVLNVPQAGDNRRRAFLDDVDVAALDQGVPLARLTVMTALPSTLAVTWQVMFNGVLGGFPGGGAAKAFTSRSQIR